MTIPSDADVMQSDSQLFMLRFWSEDLGDGQIDWRGKVQHVNSGEVIYFRDWPLLEKFVQGFLIGQAKDDIVEDVQKELGIRD